MLEKEFNFYVSNQNEIVSKYRGQFVVIIGEKIVGNYDNLETAYMESEKKHKLGTFLIQFCDYGTENYTQTFVNNNVSFK